MIADDDGPDGLLDDTDLQILTGLSEIWAETDPVPDDLALEVRFQLSVRALRAEVAELHAAASTEPSPGEPELVGVGAFRDDTPVRTDTLTFSCDQLSTMITVTSVPSVPGDAGGARGAEGTADAVRIDGWVTVPECAIELRVLTEDRQGPAVVRHLHADEDGRYTIEEVAAGPAQLVFRHHHETVVTPYFEL